MLQDDSTHLTTAHLLRRGEEEEHTQLATQHPASYRTIISRILENTVHMLLPKLNRDHGYEILARLS